MSRPKSNVERIRRPVTWRLPLRIVLVLGGLAAGIALALALTPRGIDTLSFDVGLARGAMVGLLIGGVAAALVPGAHEERPSSAPPKVRPSGFDALRAEMDKHRHSADVGAGRDTAAGDAAGPDAGGNTRAPRR